VVALRKVFLLVALTLLLYELFRDISVMTVLFICAGVASALLISRLPSSALVHTKYPFIILSFALSAGLFLYPALRTGSLPQLGALFVTFYSIALYLATIEEKGNQVAKEVIALSLLLLSASCNLILTHRPEFVLPLALTVGLFLFVMNRSRLIPLVAGYTLLHIIFLYVQKIHLFGPSLPAMNGTGKAILLGALFLLLLIAFLTYLKKGSVRATLAFFGLLCISLDLLLSFGFSFKGLLVHQPLAALLFASPVVGLVLRAEEGRR
jgi:hypothetical protein